jgi:hypothetical protein
LNTEVRYRVLVSKIFSAAPRLKQGPSLPVESEEDIFKHLDMPYKEPSERTLT